MTPLRSGGLPIAGIGLDHGIAHRKGHLDCSLAGHLANLDKSVQPSEVCTHSFPLDYTLLGPRHPTGWVFLQFTPSSSTGR